MKILHVYRTAYPETNGGLEQVIRFISTGTKKLGVETKVLALSNSDAKVIFSDGIEIHFVKKTFEVSSNGFSFALIKEFKVLHEWADLVNFHYPWPSGDLLSFFGSGKPTVVTYHSDIVRQKILRLLYHPLKTCFLNKVTKIIATSPQYAASSRTLSRYADKVKVIPLGIEPQRYDLHNYELLKQWEAKLGRSFYLFIGVLRYYKGLKYLIKAAEINGLPIVIAGDGPLRDELVRMAESKNLSNVTFVGYISEEDKVALLSLCKAFVFPSHLRSEAFGVSLLEAQLFGKPIISCEVGTGSSYVNIDGITGLVVEKENPHQLSAAMLEIETNSQLAERLGEAGKLRLRENFTDTILANEYYKVYQSLIR